MADEFDAIFNQFFESTQQEKSVNLDQLIHGIKLDEHFLTFIDLSSLDEPASSIDIALTLLRLPTPLQV